MAKGFAVAPNSLTQCWACVLIAVVFLACPGSALAVDRDWPIFPTPARVLVQKHAAALPESVVQQTLAGLAARNARLTSAPSEYIWLDAEDGFSQALTDWQQRTGVSREVVDGDVWSLVRRFQAAGVVKGYVLFAADTAGGRPHHHPPKDLSINLATSLCAPLEAIAVDQALQTQAESQGLAQLADCRGKDYAWLLEKWGDRFSRKLVALLDPRLDLCRESAVASDALVVLNHHGGGFAEGLARAAPGGLVFGWGMAPEDSFVGPITRHGLRMIAAGHTRNLPLLAADPGELPTQRHLADTTAELLRQDSPQKHYVAFVLSDGDNLAWVMSTFLQKGQFWAHPQRGKIPFGWGLPLGSLAEVGPDVWRRLLSTATPNDDLLAAGLDGYCYIDHVPASTLPDHAARLEEHLQAQGVTGAVLLTRDWNSAAAKHGYQALVEGCPSLHGLFALQYVSYAAGRGKILWCQRGQERVPVLSAHAAIWDQPNSPVAGPPRHVAGLLNRWARSPVQSSEDRFTWVIVHAWSHFGGNVGGYGAALNCASQLDQGIQVVTPTQLLSLLAAAEKKP